MKYLLMLLLVFPLCCFSEIYRWTDENGKVHFGDSPKDKSRAEKVVVEVNSYKHVTYENSEPYQGHESNRVIMYATSWCGYCKQARNHFNENGIPFTEYDIEKDERARKSYDSIGGKGVPVILVGKKRMNGFSAAGFKNIYK